jgi:hypothetical protein
MGLNSRAGVFDQLLGLKRERLPAVSPQAEFVWCGRVITDLRQVPKDHRDEVRDEYYRFKQRVKYQRDRQNPKTMARRQAYAERTAAERRAWKREYDARTRERQRAVKTAWARSNYHANAELMRARSREWYRANREKVLARLKAKTQAARVAKGAGDGQQD